MSVILEDKKNFVNRMSFKKYQYYILIFLLGVTCLSWWAVWETGKKEFHIRFFSIGQGDSIFIEDEAGHQILIDGGENKIILEKLGEVLPFFDRSLDLVILTHPNRDHLGGILEVLEKYKVEKVIYTGVESDDAYYQKFKEILKQKNIPVFFVQEGWRINLTGGAYLDFLFPLENLKGQKMKDLNESSIVCRLVRGEKEYLLMGDADFSTESALIRQNIYLKSDLLKVGHHGSKNATSENFLKAVQPEVAIISVGENRYGHPHPELLERLQSLGIKVLRTDQEGDIEY